MAHEFNYTPWRVSLSGTSVLVVDREGCMVAQVGSPNSRGEAHVRRTALLMANAPRLLKHLEKAYKALVITQRAIQLHGSEHLGGVMDEEMQAMQRAIGDAGGSTE